MENPRVNEIDSLLCLPKIEGKIELNRMTTYYNTFKYKVCY